MPIAVGQQRRIILNDLIGSAVALIDVVVEQSTGSEMTELLLPQLPKPLRDALISIPRPRRDGGAALRRQKLKEHTVELMECPDKIRPSDQTLQRALKGDRESLGRVFSSHMPQLYRAAFRILGRHQDAEEALQDGFLSAVRHLGRFERRSRFSTWLTRIVINAALMRLRKGRREMLISFDLGPDREEVDLAVTVADPGPNPEEIYQGKERFQIFERNLRKLPLRYQSILWLRDVQGMSTREAAEKLGVKSATVKSRLYRARLRLGGGGCLANPGHRSARQPGMPKPDMDLSPN
jgi:RNA polymerase sigma-70 factor, ECF subfamily